MNGVQSLTLPSISEDDENLPEEGETSPLSPANRSPMHITSPRHAKFRLAILNFIFSSLFINHQITGGEKT